MRDASATRLLLLVLQLMLMWMLRRNSLDRLTLMTTFSNRASLLMASKISGSVSWERLIVLA